MEIGKYWCRAYPDESITVRVDDINRVELFIEQAGDNAGVVLSKEDAIELAMDIITHYNVTLSA